MEKIICPICYSLDIKLKYDITYTSDKVVKVLNITNVPQVFLYSCKNCNHHFTHPKIDNHLLHYYYSSINSEYYDSLKKEEDLLVGKHEDIVKMVSNIKYDGGKILEIGCGYGYLIGMFAGEKWDKYAIEPSGIAVEHIKNVYPDIKITNSFFTASFYKKNYFDVVLLFDVIEHIDDPNNLCKEVFEILKPDGLFIIGTGNIDSLNAKISRNKWEYFGSWEHISFFTPHSISYLLKQNGFQVSKIFNVSYNGLWLDNIKIFLHNILIQNIKNILKTIYKYFDKNDIVMSKYHLSFDHIIVVAKK